MTKTEAFTQALQKLGHDSRVDSDGDVFTEIDGLTYVFYAEPSDHEFLRVSVRLRKLRDNSQYWPALDAINQVNRRNKVAKAWLAEDSGISVGIEAQITSAEEIIPVLGEYLYYAQGAIRALDASLAAIP